MAYPLFVTAVAMEMMGTKSMQQTIHTSMLADPSRSWNLVQVAIELNVIVGRPNGVVSGVCGDVRRRAKYREFPITARICCLSNLNTRQYARAIMW